MCPSRTAAGPSACLRSPLSSLPLCLFASLPVCLPFPLSSLLSARSSFECPSCGYDASDPDNPWGDGGGPPEPEAAEQAASPGPKIGGRRQTSVNGGLGGGAKRGRQNSAPPKPKKKENLLSMRETCVLCACVRDERERVCARRRSCSHRARNVWPSTPRSIDRSIDRSTSPRRPASHSLIVVRCGAAS